MVQRKLTVKFDSVDIHQLGVPDENLIKRFLKTTIFSMKKSIRLLGTVAYWKSENSLRFPLGAKDFSSHMLLLIIFD